MAQRTTDATKIARPCLLACLLLALSAGARADDAVVSGKLVVEPPTLICLGFEWDIAGDANRNASVAVSYREPGEEQWREALPLLRRKPRPATAA